MKENLSNKIWFPEEGLLYFTSKRQICVLECQQAPAVHSNHPLDQRTILK